MNLHEKAQKSSERFRQPENFDSVEKGAGWSLYVGANDWEDSLTAMAVVFPGDEEIKRVWASIKYPRGLSAIRDGELKRAKLPEAKKHAERAWRTWLRTARRKYRETEEGHTKSWKTAFQTALADRDMAKYVEEWGIDRTEWKAVPESAAHRVVRKLIEDIEDEVDQLPEYFDPEDLVRGLRQRGLPGTLCHAVAMAMPDGSHKDMFAVYWSVPDGDEPYIERADKAQKTVYATFNELYPHIRKFEARSLGNSFGLIFDPVWPALKDDYIDESEDDLRDEIDQLKPAEVLRIKVVSDWGEHVFDASGRCIEYMPYADTEDWEDEEPPETPSRLDIEEFQRAYPGRKIDGDIHSISDFGYTTEGGTYVPPDATYRQQVRAAFAATGKAPYVRTQS
jgi:hypothetical protein